MMHPSFDCQRKEFLKHQQETSQTLSSFNISPVDMAIYYNPSASEGQLLNYALSHPDIHRIQNELEDVQAKVAFIVKSQYHKQTNNCFVGFSQNLTQVSDSIIISLAKVQAYRKTLQQKLKISLLLRAKQTNRKNTVKANLFKYKQLLLAIKKLKTKVVDYECNHQYELNEERSRLQTSGLMLVPSLLQKGLLNLVIKALYQTRREVKIQEIYNLKTIINAFMDSKFMKCLLSSNQIQQQAWSWLSNSDQQLYFKFKQYIHLKRYLNIRTIKQDVQINTQSTQYGASDLNRSILDKLCQSKINQYLHTYPQSIKALQIMKVYSVSQCQPIINKFLQCEIQILINDLFQKIVSFSQNCKDKLLKINRVLVHDIIAKNKHKKQYKMLQMPSYYANCAENDVQFMFDFEQLGELFQEIQSKGAFLQVFLEKYNLSLNPIQINDVLTNLTLRVLMEPLLKIRLGYTKIISRKEQQRKYQYVRQIFNHIQPLKELFFSENVKRHEEVLYQLKNWIKKNEERNQIYCKSKEQESNNKVSQEKRNLNKQNRKQKTKIKKENQVNLTMAQFYIKYHEKYGQIFLYLINKYVHTSKSNHNQVSNKADIKMQKYVGLWRNLIAEQIMRHQLQEMQPANLFSQFQFMQQAIIELVEEKHQIQIKLHQIETYILRKKENKNHLELTEEQKQLIYNKIMRLNFKTRNYKKLMAFHKILGEYSQMKSLHSQMYDQLQKEINLWT